MSNVCACQYWGLAILTASPATTRRVSAGWGRRCQGALRQEVRQRPGRQRQHGQSKEYKLKDSRSPEVQILTDQQIFDLIYNGKGKMTGL